MVVVVVALLVAAVVVVVVALVVVAAVVVVVPLVVLVVALLLLLGDLAVPLLVGLKRRRWRQRAAVARQPLPCVVEPHERRPRA